jgi:hypothetical protein
MNGENDFGKSTNLYSVDLTYKWKTVQFNTYKSLVFQNEFISAMLTWIVPGSIPKDFIPC